LKALRALLRDTIRLVKLDFDSNIFASELLEDVRKRQPEFANESEPAVREKYVSHMCDLLTVCIFATITPAVKEAFQKRASDNRDFLHKYYHIVSQIQYEAVVWLQAVVKDYKINPKERITCLLKILFLSEKPEIYHQVDEWPPEKERQLMMKIVSDIPVISEILYQVLLMADSLPGGYPVFMLEVQERLLKAAASVQLKEAGLFRPFDAKLIDNYHKTLFKLTFYKYPSEYDLHLPKSFNPPQLVVNSFYWKASLILLLLSVVDPKGFGWFAWQNYPTLKVLMEMIMTEDYNFPPQSSVTHEMSVEKYRAVELQVFLLAFFNRFQVD